MAGVHETVIRKIRQLPPLPLAAQKLLTMVDDERTSAEGLTKVLKSDAALAAKVLQLVNSAFYGFSRKITTLSHAVVILGFSAIKNVAIGFAACEVLKKLEGPVNWERYWLHGVTCASCGQAVAEAAGYRIPEEAFIACLLHDVGYAVLAAVAPAVMHDLALRKMLGDLEQESAALGINHAEAGQMVMEHWKIPQQLCRVIRFHHSPQVVDADNSGPLLALVVFSDVFAYLSGYGYHDQMQPYCYDTLLQKLGVMTDDYGALFKGISARLNATRAFFDLPLEEANNVGRRVVIISADCTRAHWLKNLTASWGFEIMHESALHGIMTAEQQQNLCVLLDGSSLQAQPMALLNDCLRTRGIQVRRILPLLSTESGDVGAEGDLPYLFTRLDLEHIF